MNDLVSIIVPLYNYRDYIEENILSIQLQSYPDWEIIIVDDGSKDDPYPVIKPYESDKIKYIKLDKNGGYSAAKNVGIRASKGSMIVVLDADDMLTSESLKCRVEFLQTHEVSWVHGLALEFHNTKPYDFHLVKRKAHKKFKGIQKSGDYTEVWTCIHAQSVMVCRSAYQRVGLYEETLYSMGDKEMWARLLHHVGNPGYVNAPIAYYRQHDKQMHRSKKKLRNLKKIKKHMHNLVKTRRKKLDGVEKL